MKLDDVIPWGRSFKEYERMFDLGKDDLSIRILGCGDGPASFNSQGTELGCSIVSADPIYAFNAEQIEQRILACYEEVKEKVRQQRENYVWTCFTNPEELATARMRAMREFLSDYESGKRDGRYVTAALPTLPFENGEFDLSLCSHFLFLYSDHFDLAFHLASMRELLRVSREVRVFPLFSLNGIRSPHIDSVLSDLSSEGYDVSIRTVDYEFQRGGNQMMSVQRKA
jgi:hypothetical protein